MPPKPKPKPKPKPRRPRQPRATINEPEHTGTLIQMQLQAQSNQIDNPIESEANLGSGKRRRTDSAKVRELAQRSTEAEANAEALASQRAAMRFQNEVHDPSRQEIRAFLAGAPPRPLVGPGTYETGASNFQRIVNKRALHTEMLANQIQHAHAFARSAPNGPPIGFVSPQSQARAHPSEIAPAAASYVGIPCTTVPNHHGDLPASFTSPFAGSSSASVRYSEASPVSNAHTTQEALESNEESDADDGEYPKFDQRRQTNKDTRRRERALARNGPRTQRERKRDNNMNRPSLADIDPEHQPVISSAIEIYSAMLINEDPLGLKDSAPLVRAAMQQAISEDGEYKLKPNRFVIRLMTARNNNIRAPFIECARKHVPIYYGFNVPHAADDTKTRQINQDNCSKLIHHGRFATADHTVAEITGPYMCPLFGRILKECCYDGKKPLGHRITGGWQVVSLPYLAFSATLVQHCISEWETGESVEKKFVADKHSKIYNEHLRQLELQRNEAPGPMKVYCKSLIEQASGSCINSTNAALPSGSGIPDRFIKGWSARYEVTGSSLVQSSRFTGGRAFGVGNINSVFEPLATVEENFVHAPPVDFVGTTGTNAARDSVPSVAVNPVHSPSLPVDHWQPSIGPGRRSVSPLPSSQNAPLDLENTQTESEADSIWESIRPSQSISQVIPRLPNSTHSSPATSLAASRIAAADLENTQTESEADSIWESVRPSQSISQVISRLPNSTHSSPATSLAASRIAPPDLENTQTESEADSVWESIRPSQSISQVIPRLPNSTRSSPATSGLSFSSHPFEQEAQISWPITLGQMSSVPTVNYYGAPDTQTESEASTYMTVTPSQSISQRQNTAFFPEMNRPTRLASTVLENSRPPPEASIPVDPSSVA